jgi:hypothetical protein
VPPPRRGRRANGNERIDRTDCERLPRRGQSGSRAYMPDCANSADDSGSRSDRASRGLHPSANDRFNPTKKKAQNKATDERLNALFERRNGVMNKGLSARLGTRGVKPKPTSAVATRSIWPDARPVELGGAVRGTSAPTVPAHSVELHDRNGYSDNESDSGLQTGRPRIRRVVWGVAESVRCPREMAASESEVVRVTAGWRREHSDGGRAHDPQSVIDPIVNRVRKRTT